MMLALVVATTMATAFASAQDPCNPEGITRRAELNYQGRTGVWFDGAVARCMLADIAELPLLRERVNLFDQRLLLSREHLGFMTEQLALANAATERATGALEAAVRGQREATEALDAWYRSPLLWFITGIVVTGGVVLLAAEVR